MKKIIWIYSVSSQGIGPLGSGPRQTLRQSKLFQKSLKSILPQNIDLQFISQEIHDNFPAADLLVIADVDLPYLNNQIGEPTIIIPIQYVVSNDFLKGSVKNYV